MLCMLRSTFSSPRRSSLPGLLCLTATALLFGNGCSVSPQARAARSLRAGKGYLAKKDYPRAVLEFSNAVQATPSDAEAYYQLGLALLGNGDVDQAASNFKKAADRNSGHSGAQLHLAELESLSRNQEAVQEGLRRAQDILGRSPLNPDALSVAGLAEIRLGQVPQAEKHLEQALAAYPEHLQAAVNLARAKLLRKDATGAEGVLKQAVIRSPRSADPLTALGQFYVAIGKPDDAEREFRRALMIDPANVTALSTLGPILWRASRLNEAEDIYRRLSTADTRFRIAHASFLFGIKKYDPAVAELKTLAAAAPDDREVRSALITAYVAANRDSEALKLLNSALQKWPKDSDALLQRSRIYLSKGMTMEAETDVVKVLSFRPESADAHFVRSKVYQAVGATVERRQELSEALNRDPKFATARLELAQVLIDLNAAKSALKLLEEAPSGQTSSLPFIVQRNWALLSAGDDRRARLGVDETLTVSRHPELVLQDGMLKWKEHNYSAAQACATEVLKQQPEDVRALELLWRSYASSNRGGAGIQEVRQYAMRASRSVLMQRFYSKLLFEDGDIDGARHVLETARSLSPKALDLFLDLSDLDVAQGNLDAARRSLSEVLPLDMQDSRVRLKLAALETTAGNYRTAIDYYRKIVAGNPRHSLALNNLAYLISEFSGNPDEALKYAQQAKELSPDSASADDTLGWIYYQKGLYALAIPYLESAVEHEPSARHKYHLAMAYMKAGQRIKGKHALDAALRLDSSIPEALRAKQVWSETTINR